MFSGYKTFRTSHTLDEARSKCEPLSEMLWLVWYRVKEDLKTEDSLLLRAAGVL